jgi:hypothetical protein
MALCRNSHLKRDPPDPAVTCSGRRTSRGESRLGRHPSRTRVSVRRLPRSGVPLRVPCMVPGYRDARLHPIPAPGTFRVGHPKGHTTARTGSHRATKEPRPALGQPGPRSESGTRLGPDLLKFGFPVNLAALAWSAGDR